ncbi:MAG: hypothetical protein WC602_00900 [archaeon]
MAEIRPDELVKTHLFFGFDDVLVNGKVSNSVNPMHVKLCLEKLRVLEDQNVLNFYIISGNSQKIALKKIADSGLKDFFKRQNVFSVTSGYVNRKSRIDRERYKEQISENSEFKDEFVKQKTFEKFMKKGVKPEKMLFIGHDLLTDAYYTLRFSKIDVAIVEKSASYMHQKLDQKVPGLTYIDVEWNDLKKVIMGNIPKPDYSALDKFVYQKLRNELFKDVPPIKVGK